jgi:hypothetical protein
MKNFNKIWMEISRHTMIRKALDRLGIQMVPFYLFLEHRSFVNLSHLKERFAGYETRFMDAKDMPEMVDLPGRDFPLTELLSRLEAGCLCYGMKRQGDLVAFTWSEMDLCNSKFYSFPLKSNEAYLFDAYTKESYRGKGVAPYIRWLSYLELSELGKHNLYSISVYFDPSAVRFKMKLNAKIIGLSLYVQALKKFHFTLPLRKTRKRWSWDGRDPSVSPYRPDQEG